MHATLVVAILLFLSPSVYLYVSITQTDKRTDYLGKEISMKVKNKKKSKKKINLKWMKQKVIYE